MKYNHAYTIAFSVDSDNKAEDVTADELIAGMSRRLRDLVRNGDEIVEATGMPFDTYIVEEDPLVTLTHPKDHRYRLDLRKPVDIYRNLTKQCWSVRQGAVVKGHISYDKEFVVRNADLVVSEKGRQRVLRQKQKNVHAFVRGLLSPPIPPPECKSKEGGLKERRITYNPYTRKTFYLAEQGSALTGADFIYSRDGQLYIYLYDIPHAQT